MIVKVCGNKVSKLYYITLWSAVLMRVKRVSGRLVDTICLVDIFDDKFSDNKLYTNNNLGSGKRSFFKKVFLLDFHEEIVIFAFKHVFKSTTVMRFGRT